MDSESDDLIINQCPECSNDLNVTDFSPYSKITCPYCSAAVRIRTRLGQYEIKGLLGAGGMSQVFAADDLTLGRKVALKILHQSLSLDSKLTDMFEREAKLTASINHPNVVKVYTVGSENGYFYIAMELVDAVSVEQMIGTSGALPEKQVLNIAYDVVSGLKAAFQGNLIHRDIKPGNMLVTKDGTAKLVDFGLAVAQGGADENEDIWATPFYVPPEKLVREPDTYLGDIYALGATCYHAIAGQPPFKANTNSLEDLIAIKSAGVDLKSVAPNTSDVTISLIEQMMAHSAEERPGSYDQLLKKIKICQEQFAPKKDREAGYSSSKKKGPAKAIFAIVVAAAIGLGVYYVKGKSDGVFDDLDSLFPGSGDRVISAEEREAAQKMLAGRQAMVKNRFSEARNIFRELEGNKAFTQPTQGWNTFNQGLVELLTGNEIASRKHFAKLVKQKGFNDPAQKKYEVFFKKVGSVLADPLPVLRSDITTDKSSFEVIGLLAAGLKNWEQGQFDEANSFFRDFSKVEIPASDPWIGEMRPLVEVYREDFSSFKAVPNPSRKMDVKELNLAKRDLDRALRSLKSKGKMKDVVQSRLKRVDELIKLAGNPGTGPDGSSASGDSTWTAEELKELSELQTAVSGFDGYKTTYLFSGAVLRLNSIQVKTPKGSALRDDLISGYKSADQFIGSFAKRISEEGYYGKIRRKEGKDLDATITSADTEHFIIDLGFGPNEVEIEKLDPGWMVEVAEQTLDAPSEETLTEWKEVFWFANACGLSEDSRRIATKLVGIDRDFLEAGKRFRRINF